ncbi:hypothetical protein SpCBS45565_g01685 [Spizellomyces sp. 'palustris']|nr:hypothetical protein SpCBS45565_g01685 [Spizellomyces sp. 'palustris']
MKFAQHLQEKRHTPWFQYYTDYKELKKVLKRLEREHKTHSQTFPILDALPPVTRFTHKALQDEFFSQLEQEVDKVEWFYLVTLEKVQKECQEVMAKWFWATHHRPHHSHNQGTAPSAPPSPISHHLHNLLTTITRMQTNFLPLNRLAIAKILKKHDKLESTHGGAATKQAMVERIRQHRRFWDADELNKVAEDVKSFRWEMNKARIRLESDSVR